MVTAPPGSVRKSSAPGEAGGRKRVERKSSVGKERGE